MSTPVPTRFDPDELAALDHLVAEGVAPTRSEAIRLAVARLVDQLERESAGRAIVASYTAVPQSADEDAAAMANAVALIDAEPW